MSVTYTLFSLSNCWAVYRLTYDLVSSAVELNDRKIPATRRFLVTPFCDVRLILSPSTKFIFSAIPIPITMPFGSDFRVSNLPSTIDEIGRASCRERDEVQGSGRCIIE